MWNQKVTLYIDDTSLRLMVTQGQKVKKWADMRIEPGLIKDSVVLQEAEVGARIRSLFKSQKVRARKVILGVSGLHSLTRPANLPLLPKSMLAEAVTREARRVLPVPLDQLYLSWKVMPGPKGRTSVYLAATPRKSIDSIMRSLKHGGLDASRMAIKPLALTKAIPLNSAILVDLQPTEFDIVIMVDGISQPVRSVSLPNEELAWEQKIRMIVTDLERTLRFYATNNPEKPLEVKAPIFVSGELIGRPQHQKVLEEASGRSVIPIAPPFKGLEQFDPGRYMANLTIVLSSASPGREMTFPVANLNMLPVPYQPKPISLAKVVGIPGSFAAAAMVIPMLMIIQSTGANSNIMQEQLDTLNQIMNQKTVQKIEIKKQITELEKLSTAAQADFESVNTSLNAITSDQDAINGDLLLSLSKLSGTIHLKSLKETAEKLEIIGTAPTNSDIEKYVKAILVYARDLDISERFSESVISSLTVVTPSGPDAAALAQSGTPQQIEFTLSFTRGK